MKSGKQLCTFYVHELLFGVEVERVQEVIRYQEMTRVPLSHPAIAGLINLRGQIVTAIDLCHQLSLPTGSGGGLPMNVVLRREDGPTSLLVDEVGEVVEVEKQWFEEPPDTLSSPRRDFIRGICKLNRQLLLLLDIDKALSVPATQAA